MLFPFNHVNLGVNNGRDSNAINLGVSLVCCERVGLLQSSVLILFNTLLLIRLTKCFHGISTWLMVWFFSHPGFWSGNLFLIAPFPDLCLLVPFYNL